MTTQEVLETVAAMPSEEWMKIQSGIAEMVAARFSAEETSEIREALAEAEAEFERGEGIGSEEMRRRFRPVNDQIVRRIMCRAAGAILEKVIRAYYRISRWRRA